MSEPLYTADEVRALVNAAVDRMRFACEEVSLGGKLDPHLKASAARIKGYLEPLGTPNEDKTYEELFLPPRDAVWKPLDSIPRDGTPFVMLIQHTFRWNPYKDLGKVKATIGKKAQKLDDGTTGRWQVIDDKGTWVNTVQPKGMWRP